jgi:hypothetical protein
MEQKYNYTQEDIDDLCHDTYLDFFIDLFESEYIFNIELKKIILNIIENNAIKLFELFESNGLISIRRETYFAWLLYAYSQESKSIIDMLELKYSNDFNIIYEDKIYFQQNCLIEMSRCCLFDSAKKFAQLNQIDLNQQILINKELGDKINDILSCRIILYSDVKTNTNIYGYS